MEELTTVKKTLKKWESTFIEEHKRKPGKIDIDKAPQDIKGAYQRYKDLKQINQSNHADKEEKNSKHENIPDKEVWGHGFDRTNTTKTEIKITNASQSKQSPFLQNLGKKMFEKSLKLNIHQTSGGKSSNQWKKPDTPRRGLGPGPVFSAHKLTKDGEPENNSSDPFNEPNTLENNEPFNDEEISAPLPVFKSLKFGKLLDKSSSTPKETKSEHKVADWAPCLNKFQTKTKSNISVFSKNLSKLVSKHNEKYNESWNDEGDDDDTMDVDNGKHGDEVDGDDADSGGHSWHVPVKDLIIEDIVYCDKSLKPKITKPPKSINSLAAVDEIQGSTKKDPSSTSKRTAHIPKDSQFDTSPTSENDHQLLENSELRTDYGGSKRAAIKKKLPIITETYREPDLGDIDERESIGKKITRKRKPNVIESDGDEDNAASPSGDPEEVKGADKKGKGKERAAKPAAKRKKLNTGESMAVNPEGDVADQEQTNKPIVKKVARTKPLSNDNFLRLNMKVKTYQRKGRQMTGGQHRRQQWKQKMKDRSKSRGDACFKCGQEGHWASKCRGSANKPSTANKEPTIEDDFPSMQEAAEMARGIRLEQKQVKAKPKPTASVSKKPAMEMDDDDGSMDTVNPAEERDIDLEIQSEIVRTRREVEPVRPAMEPLIDTEDDLDEIPDFVQKGLKKFGYDSFRPGQKESVMRILSGQSTLVVLSTGGGKSLCYQLPAYLYAQRSSCITLVISPLVSLMEDQVTGLPKGVVGMCLHTNMTAIQREKVLTTVKEGKAQFLLVSPEAIAGGSMTLISSMASLPPVAFVCIDEAHCLSEWSHNFRPSYLRLCKVLRDKLGIQCFLGLTATATFSTAADVSRHLNITDFKKATVRGSPIPLNLQLSVSRDDDREQALINLLQGDRFCNLESIIIYCTRRDQTEKVATMIRTCLNKGAPIEARKGRKRPKLEWDAESYHAGLTPAQRKRVQNYFMSGNLRVVVATVAFGMGLDKADVRAIIHYNMPKSFESYVQEIGRAGRDGELAQCHVFLDAEGKDLCELRRHTYANTVDYKTLKKLVQKIFAPCRCRDVHEQHAMAAKEVDEFDDCDNELIEACMNNDLKDPGPTTKVVNKGEAGDQIDNFSSSSTGEVKHGSRETSDASMQLEQDHIVTSTGTYKDVKHGSRETSDASIQLEQDQSVNVTGSYKVTEHHEHADHEKEADKTGVTIATDAIRKQRLCPGHERALPIEQTVIELDVKEEGISTLLCYLELHSSQWLENLPSVYANCKIQCYEGPGQLQAISKKCPPVAVAIAKCKKDGKTFSNTNLLEFPVVEISDCMGWDSGPVKKELKLLQWDFSSGTAPKRTGVMIEFSDLAYHFRSPGDFTSMDMDDVLEFLHTRMQRQEKSEIYNLSKLHKSLKSVAHKNYWMCADSLDMTKNDKLKAILNEYFDSQPTNDAEANQMQEIEQEPVPEISLNQAIADIRQFINVYGQEHALSGRAIARIFHGIASPCYPAQTWGRVRRFWRSHLNVDFNELMKTATKELITLRR